MDKFKKLVQVWEKNNESRLELTSRDVTALRLFASWLDDEALKEEQWRHVYAKRLVSRGYDVSDARESAQAAEYDPDIDPCDAADDEYSYEMTS